MSRSFLFVPADNERKLSKSQNVNADALILDLEDSVQSRAKVAARKLASEFLSEQHDAEIWVRINPLDSVDALADLRSVVPRGPTGIVLPKPKRAREVKQLSILLDVIEQDCDLEAGETGVLPIVTERPDALFHLHEYSGITSRLRGLTWGAEDLSAFIGARATRDADGRWLPPYEMARTLTLLAACAAGAAPIDTVYTDFRNLDGLAAYARSSARDGFVGMLAIHPHQVDVINAAFIPTDDEIVRAQEIVALFAADPHSGAHNFDGEMIDKPHLLQAERVLRLASMRDRNIK